MANPVGDGFGSIAWHLPPSRTAGERKLKVMGAQDPWLLRQPFDANGQALEAVLAGVPDLSRRQRRRCERALAHRD